MSGVAYVCAVALASLMGNEPKTAVEGQYIEVRNADLWADPSSTKEPKQGGESRGILAWKVKKGEFQNVSLDGLGIVAIVTSDQTLGSGKSKTALIVDQKATEAQQKALIAMARALAGNTIQDVVAVDKGKVFFFAGECDGKGCALLTAGVARIWTRCLCPEDKVTAQMKMTLPALAKVNDPVGVFALESEYTGKALGPFSHNAGRSAILANFSL